MAWTQIKKDNDFIYCPQCGSDQIVDTDYEVEIGDGEYGVDEDGRHCYECGWEGDDQELVCKDDEDHQ